MSLFPPDETEKTPSDALFSDALFSVIIPVFNGGEKLEISLRSVFPTDLPLEVLVMDGASSDGTTARLARLQEEFGAKLRWFSSPDDGVYDAMNRGIALARGRYLFFLGAGDELRSGALAKVCSLLPDDNQSLLYGRVWKVYDGVEYGSRMENIDLARRNLPHQAAFFGRELFERLGSYSLDFPILSDHEFNIRCFGTPWVKRIYLDFVVCDYEGGGLSDTRTDTRFFAQKNALVRRELGARAALILWIDEHFPAPLQRAMGRVRQNLARFKPR